MAPTPKQRWLTTSWPVVREQLPPPPAAVIDVGCGSLGGFVPMLLEQGWSAIGIDPESPPGPDYRATTFEDYQPPEPVEAVVASMSLHHVHDVGDMLDQVAAALVPGGTVVVLEWAWERFDDATAQWCFARLAPPATEDEEGWLHHHRVRWTESGLPWPDYWREWTTEEGLHPGAGIVSALDARFERQASSYGPHFHPELDATDRGEEIDAIAAGTIRASGITWVGGRL
ncbi:MAG: class I SAM-dependent methyltransferase [Nocardioidaceae bacterium]